MARKPTIDIDMLISLTEQFYLEKCSGNPSMLKPSKIAEYMRSQGYSIQDYSIRRNEVLMKHINKLKKNSEQVHFKIVSVYRDTDIDSFIRMNNTKEKLKTALQEKDNYYREVSRSAAFIFKENKKLQTLIQQYHEKIEDLEKQLLDNRSNTITEEIENKSYMIENQKLHKIIDTYVYPEIANELLKKQGLLKNTANIVNPASIDIELTAADSDISELKNNVLRELFSVI